MSKPLLSICIPTYNRCDYLVKSIESIIKQPEFKEKQVEIVISDNASTDNTKQICERYADKYDNILYFRNTVNINNENFPLALSRGNGILRRLCNDTLCFRNGSLKRICEIIKIYETERPFICWLGVKEKPSTEKVNFEEGIKRGSYWITSISCFSVWDNECDGIEMDTYGAELLLWQVRKTLDLACEKDSMILVNEILTTTQSVENKNVNYGLYHVFYENYFTLLSPFIENKKLTVEDKEFIEKDILLNFFSNWCAKWKVQNTTLQYSKTEDLCECIYQKFHNKSYWSEYMKRYRLACWKCRIKGFAKRLMGESNGK